MLRRSSTKWLLRRRCLPPIKNASSRPPPPPPSEPTSISIHHHHHHHHRPSPLALPSIEHRKFSTTTTTTTTTATSSSSSGAATPNDNHQLVIGWLDPQDQAFALQVLSQHSPTQPQNRHIDSFIKDGPEEEYLESATSYRKQVCTGSSIAVSCNILLEKLAEAAGEPAAVDKAFAYLGRMRAQKEVYAHEEVVVPSRWARECLIRACVRMVRGAQLSEIDRQKQKHESGGGGSGSGSSSISNSSSTTIGDHGQQQTQPPQRRLRGRGHILPIPMATQAANAKYIGLAEALFEEYLLLADKQIKEVQSKQAQAKAQSKSSTASANKTHTHTHTNTEIAKEVAVTLSHYKKGIAQLGNSMIYLYTQANQPTKTLALFDRLSGRGSPAAAVSTVANVKGGEEGKSTPPFTPTPAPTPAPSSVSLLGAGLGLNSLALGAVVKVHALQPDTDPCETWSLLMELEHRHKLQVDVHTGTYMLLLQAMQRKLAAKPPCSDQAYRKLSRKLLGHFFYKHETPPPARVWHGLMKVAALRGRTKTVKHYMKLKKEEGMETDAFEYALLIEAMGEGKDLEGLRDVEEEGRDIPVGALVLDLHKLSGKEAELLLAREFQAMREKFDAVYDLEEGWKGKGTGTGQNGKEKDEKQLAKANNHKKNNEDGVVGKEGGAAGGATAGGGGGLQDIILITGFRRRLGTGQGAALLANPNLPIIETNETEDGTANVLKEVAREFLGARGIFFYSPPKNPGRVVVPQASIREYFDRQKKAESEVKFFRLTLLRYIPVASLTALFFLVPKDGLPF